MAPFIPTNKVNASTVAPWPQMFDLDNDVIKRGEADNFKAKLVSALRTRGLYSPLLLAAPTLLQVLGANPGLSNDEAVDHLDNFIAVRNKDLAMVADLLPQTIKMTSLLLFHPYESILVVVVSASGAVLVLVLTIWEILVHLFALLRRCVRIPLPSAH